METLVSLRNTFFHFGYTKILKPIIFSINPETTHDIAIFSGKILASNPLTRALTGLCFNYNNPMLNQEIAKIPFRNPVGLAAGFDKNAELPSLLPHVGFGFMEMGSITGEYCDGNKKPRLWRLPRVNSIIVYYGLKNVGAERIAKRLRNRKFNGVLGISAAKTNCKETIPLQAGIKDYCKVLENFKEIGQYYTINISCPNAYGGLDFADPERLEKLFTEMKNRQLFCKPTFVKMSPDLTLDQLDALVAVCIKYPITGLICSNLVKKHMPESFNEKEKAIWQKGGLSGKPVQKHSFEKIRHLYKTTKGKLILVGCGGVFSAEDAYMYIRNGASLVQLISGIIFEGPQAVSAINQGLVKLLKRDGFKNISEAIGVDVK